MPQSARQLKVAIERLNRSRLGQPARSMGDMLHTADEDVLARLTSEPVPPLRPTESAPPPAKVKSPKPRYRVVFKVDQLSRDGEPRWVIQERTFWFVWFFWMNLFSYPGTAPGKAMAIEHINELQAKYDGRKARKVSPIVIYPDVIAASHEQSGKEGRLSLVPENEEGQQS